MKLLIATGFYNLAAAYSPYIASLVNTVKVLTLAGIEFDFLPHNGDSYVDRFRNTVCAKFLEGDYTDLLFIDSDMDWEVGAINRILMAPVEVVGGVYPMKNNWDQYPVGLQTHPDGKPKGDPKTGLLKADWVMAGFLRIKRTCLEKMQEAYADTVYQDVSADPAKPDRVYYKFFETRLGIGGEDMTFCQRWRDIGGEIWLEPRITFGHYGVKGWQGNYHEFLMRQPGGSKANIKKLYVENFNSCIPDLSDYLDFEPDYTKADAILLWNDELKQQREICAEANRLDIPTFVMSHGAYNGPYSSSMYAKGNDARTVADYYLTWGENDKELAIKQGCKPEKAIVVGCPLFLDAPHQPDGETVVYFPTHDEANNEESIKVWQELKEIPGIKPVVKLLHMEHRPENYPGEKVFTDRRRSDHIAKTYAALKNASCVVVDDCGTHVILACHLDIPIVKIRNKYENFYDCIFETGDLHWAIMDSIQYPRKREEERQSFKKLYDHGDCAANIAKIITEVINRTINVADNFNTISTVKLNLACGQNKLQGFINVDVVPDCDQQVDLESFPWPWDNESIDEIYCSHYIEHTPDLIAFMDECYRVLKANGRAVLVAPYYNSIRAWQDPTHVRAISEATFAYYNKNWREINKLDHYNIKSDFNSEISLVFNPEWANKTEEEIKFAIKHYVNVVDDIQAVLTRTISI